MTNNFHDLTTRNLFISLCSHMSYMQGQLEALHQLDDPDDHYWFRESVALRQKVADHLTALADEPAVPEGREPAAVAGQFTFPAEGPTDDEVEVLADQLGLIRGHANHPCGFWIDDGDAGALVRAALARWGNPVPAPPANREVAELVAWLREQLHVCLQAPWTPGIKHFGRAADLLEQQATAYAICERERLRQSTRVADLEIERHPVPVPVSERLPGPEDCDAEGRCWWLALHQSWPCLYLMKADIALAAAVATHWLPAHALPLPEVGE